MPDADEVPNMELDKKFRELLTVISAEEVSPTLLKLAQHLQDLLDKQVARAAVVG